MKAVSAREFARILEKKGWRLIRTRGSHHVYILEGMSARISLPIHGNQSLKEGLQRHFMRIASLNEEDL